MPENSSKRNVSKPRTNWLRGRKKFKCVHTTSGWLHKITIGTKVLLAFILSILIIWCTNYYIKLKHCDQMMRFPHQKPEPWFMTSGKLSAIPSKEMTTRVWPEDYTELKTDRLINQLLFVPAQYSAKEGQTEYKTILLIQGLGYLAKINGSSCLSYCPVNKCIISNDSGRAYEADLILIKHFPHPLNFTRRPEQIWMFYFSESPPHFDTIQTQYKSVYNWTAGYYRKSDILAPYGKWVYYNESIKQLCRPLKNYAENKTKKVAWFVSNCEAKNNRLQYASNLSKFIQVDIYGGCGFLECSRSRSQTCFDVLKKDYKFYLSFENSNCYDYITEKFFENALQNDVLPIVMGARREDYARVAPLNSYIHVDDFESPKQLAEYLHKLDKDDDLYNSYFLWKGTGELIGSHFFCRLCALLHSNYPNRQIHDITNMWQGVCTSGSWRDV